MTKPKPATFAARFFTGRKGDVVGEPTGPGSPPQTKILLPIRGGPQPSPGEAWVCEIVRDTNPTDPRKGAFLVRPLRKCGFEEEVVFAEGSDLPGFGMYPAESKWAFGPEPVSTWRVPEEVRSTSATVERRTAWTRELERRVQARRGELVAAALTLPPGADAAVVDSDGVVLTVRARQDSSYRFQVGVGSAEGIDLELTQEEADALLVTSPSSFRAYELTPEGVLVLKGRGARARTPLQAYPLAWGGWQGLLLQTPWGDLQVGEAETTRKGFELHPALENRLEEATAILKPKSIRISPPTHPDKVLLGDEVIGAGRPFSYTYEKASYLSEDEMGWRGGGIGTAVAQIVYLRNGSTRQFSAGRDLRETALADLQITLDALATERTQYDRRTFYPEAVEECLRDWESRRVAVEKRMEEIRAVEMGSIFGLPQVLLLPHVREYIASVEAEAQRARLPGAELNEGWSPEAKMAWYKANVLEPYAKLQAEAKTLGVEEGLSRPWDADGTSIRREQFPGWFKSAMNQFGYADPENQKLLEEARQRHAAQQCAKNVETPVAVSTPPQKPEPEQAPVTMRPWLLIGASEQEGVQRSGRNPGEGVGDAHLFGVELSLSGARWRWELSWSGDASSIDAFPLTTEGRKRTFTAWAAVKGDWRLVARLYRDDTLMEILVADQEGWGQVYATPGGMPDFSNSMWRGGPWAGESALLKALFERAGLVQGGPVPIARALGKPASLADLKGKFGKR